jgi:hypothetical protein
MLSEMLQQLAVEGKNRSIETLPSNVGVVAKTTTTTMMKEENLCPKRPYAEKTLLQHGSGPRPNTRESQSRRKQAKKR